METRLGRSLFTIFLEWVWIFSTTSIQDGTRAEVVCIPACQLPPVAALARDLAALDFANAAEVSAEELAGFIDGPSGSRRTEGEGGERRGSVEGTAEEESSARVLPRLDGEGRDEFNAQHKLPDSKEFEGGVLRTASHAVAGTSARITGVDDNNGTESENVASAEATGWRRTRSPRSTETWSGFRPEVAEDVSFPDQEELQLTSSTFALSEDTAHNQAMVHWSGQNSSVSDFYAQPLFSLTHRVAPVHPRHLGIVIQLSTYFV